MKYRVMSQLAALVLLVLVLALAGGCSLNAAEEKVDQVEDRVENTLEDQATPPMNQDAAALTQEEAQKIALTHAGFTADQVTGLHVRFEVDDGVPEYEVDFIQDGWEYDYTIHADTGDVLDFDKDND